MANNFRGLLFCYTW